MTDRLKEMQMYDTYSEKETSNFGTPKNRSLATLKTSKQTELSTLDDPEPVDLLGKKEEHNQLIDVWIGFKIQQ